MYDKGITPYLQESYRIWRETLLSLPSPYKELGEKTAMISSMDEYDNITKHEVLKMGSIILLFVHLQ